MKALKLFAIAVGGFVLLVGALFAYAAISHGVNAAAASNLDDIKAQVAADAAAQYAIAKRNGSAVDACVSAGATAAAFLQAQDATAYAQWKQVERTDCSAAGVAR